MSDLIKVGMADLKLCPRGQGITTLGLGSCNILKLYINSHKILLSIFQMYTI